MAPHCVCVVNKINGNQACFNDRASPRTRASFFRLSIFNSCKFCGGGVFINLYVMGDKDYDATYKILILGDSGVGKTCLIFRFIEDIFSDSYISTIGKLTVCYC